MQAEKKKVVLDSNAVLRYLTKDDEEKAEEVLQIIQTAEKVIITIPTIFEVVFVLKSTRHQYKWTREQIADTLTDLLAMDKVECDPLLLEALFLWREERKVDDLEDIFNCLVARNEKASLLTYDNALQDFCSKLLF